MVFVLTLTLRARPSCPTLVPNTKASGQQPHGALQSVMKTKSPIFTFGHFSCHFCLLCSSGIYCLSHLLQNWDTTCCTRRHCLGYVLPSWMMHQGKDAFPPKWFGVRGVSSRGSSLHFVSGHPFTIHSTLQNMLWSMSSVKRERPWRMALRTLPIVLIILSQMPPWCEAYCVLNFHSTSFLHASQMTLLQSSWRRLCVNSACVPTRFVPLSNQTHSGYPRQAMKRANPFMNGSVSRLGRSSMYIALVVKQVYVHPYLLTSARPYFT